MDERMLKAMVAAGAIKKVDIIASGARINLTHWQPGQRELSV